MNTEYRMENKEYRKGGTVFFLLCTILFSIFYILPTEANASVTLGTANTSALSSGLVGYWPFDGATTNWKTGTTADVSGQGNTGNLIGMSTTSSPALGKIGQSFKFVRNVSTFTGYVSVPDSTSLENSAVSSFTVSFWIRLPVNYSDGNNSNIIEKDIDSASPGWGVYLNGGNSDFKIRLARTGGFIDVIAGKSYSLFATSTWSQAAIVVNKNTNLASWYINGVQTGTPVNISAATSMLNTQPLNIGAGASGLGNDTMGGNLDDVRIYNRALSAQEVALLYASGNANAGHSNASGAASSSFNFGLTAGLVGYWPLDGSTTNWKTNTTNDLSGQGNTAAIISMSTTTTPVIGKIGQAFNFTGGNFKGLIIPSITTGTTFTYSAWIYTGATSNGSDNYGNLIAQDNVRGIFYRLALQKISFYYNTTDHLNTSTLALNKWHHVVVVNNTGNATFYIDGIADGTATGALSFNADAMGCDNNGGGVPSTECMNGKIDDIRLYNRALSYQEIQQLYKLGNTNAAHSSTVTLSTGLVGYWTFDGPNVNWKTGLALDSSGNGNNGILVSVGTTTAPTVGKIGQALKFNGNSSYVPLPVGLNTGSVYSVSMWIRPTSSQSFAELFTQGQIRGFYWHSQAFNYSNASSNSGTTLTLNTWHHVVGVVNGTAVNLYTDGNLNGSFGTDGASFSAINIGGHASAGGHFFNGTIDDVRMYNRALSYQEIQQLYKMGK